MAKILVTDAQDRCGLAVVRSLGRAGHEVTAASIGRRGIGLWSRHCSTRALLPDPRESLDRFAEELRHILAETPHDVLIPGRDETVYAISRRRPGITDRVRVGLPEPDAVERALDKAKLAEAATKVGLPPPEQRLCTGVAEALAAGREYGFPLLVKPVHTVFEREGRVDRHPSSWVEDDAELEGLAAERDELLVQRRVTGAVVSFGGVAGPAGLQAAVIARYVRTWPPEAGRASCSQTIAAPPELLREVEALVGALGWTGVFELELMEQPDGRLQAIDFNPRPYGSIALAGGAGVPLATIWCESLLGREPPSTPLLAPPGIRYRMEDGELHSVGYRLRRREFRAAADAVRPRRHTVHAYTALRDPLPGILHGAALARELLRGGGEA
jgi:predicted ATP-grasp superfamily ATP-dependent carboligase